MFHEIFTVSDFKIVAPYTLRITFSDGYVQVVNLLPVLRGELYGPLQSLDFFNQVRLDNESGTLVWPNEADFDPATLHDWDRLGEAMIEMARSWPDPRNGTTLSEERVEEQFDIKRHKLQYPLSAYKFPQEARIHQVRFEGEFMHVELTDGRVLSVPLWWIPTLYDAAPEEREKYQINRDRTMIIWDPDQCAINDEVRILDYLGPCEQGT